MGWTNPLKIKEKLKTTLKSSDANHRPMVNVDKKSDFVKNCGKGIHLVITLTSSSSRSTETTFKKSKDNRYTLGMWKLYLDSCATYHYFFAKELLTNIKNDDTILTDRCNAGTTVTNTRGWWGEFKAWINDQGITNLLPTPHA